MATRIDPKIKRLRAARRGASVALAVAMALGLAAGACSDPAAERTNEIPTLSFSVAPVTVSAVLPGTRVLARGSGFVTDTRFTALARGDVQGRAVDLAVNVSRVDDTTLALDFDPSVVRAGPEGAFNGVIQIQGQLGDAIGRFEVPFQAEVLHQLTPYLSELEPGLFPASPARFFGGGFIAGAEGETRLVLRGGFVRELDGRPSEIEFAEAVATPAYDADWQRDEARFVVDVGWMGNAPGHFVGEARLVNEGVGWRAEGDWQAVSLDLLPPTIEVLDTPAASRGEAVPISGQGFLGGASGGFTVLRLDGVFTADDGSVVDLGPAGLEINPTWIDGQRLVFAMRVNYDEDCQSADLGARPGRLNGGATPVTHFEGQTVEGARTPIVFDVLPARQVVFLRFLPSFTESLRLFGLRNVSGAVRDRIVEVVARDYAGINVELRLSEPEDFLEYAIVEVGGPDPNDQQLFGLDNTTGLDRCNQRLDDLLAGRNADSNDSYGGIFVESFLQFSASRGAANALNEAVQADGRTAGEVFDDIFEPVIGQPVASGEYPGGARDLEIAEAVRVLGTLVGNTVTHEIGHSLGLPVEPGCGQYHTQAGEKQIMDCGVDRPFAERAELAPGGPAVWSPADRAYLERVLPIR